MIAYITEHIYFMWRTNRKNGAPSIAVRPKLVRIMWQLILIDLIVVGCADQSVDQKRFFDLLSYYHEGL